GERRVGHGHACIRGEQPVHLPLGHGAAAHHETGPSRDVEHDRVREAHVEDSGRGSVGGACRSGRGKKRTSRSRTSGSSSQGTSSMIRMAARGSFPPRPPTKTWTPSTILPSTLTLHPWSPMSAVWWFPHEAGQPDQRTLIGRVLPMSFSNCFARAMARVLVSMRARLQKSVPVHETRPRRISEGLYGSSLRSGSCVRSPSRASGTWGRSTSWDGVNLRSPCP